MRKKNIKLRVNNLIKKYREVSPYKICKKLNINIVYHDLGNIKGYFKIVLKQKYIVINEKLDEFSQKIVLCHELGHALLHSEKSELFAKEHFLYYSSKLENEANEFAVWLLLKQYNVLTEEMIEVCDLKKEFKKDILKVLYKI